MNETMMKEALEAIVVIEEDSPAAFRAARMIAQETLDALVHDHPPHHPDEPCEVCHGADPREQK